MKKKNKFINLKYSTQKLKNLGLFVAITSDVPVSVISDRKKIHRILPNLLGNAINFTESGDISIGVSKLEASEERTHLQLIFRVRKPRMKCQSILKYANFLKKLMDAPLCY